MCTVPGTSAVVRKGLLESGAVWHRLALQDRLRQAGKVVHHAVPTLLRAWGAEQHMHFPAQLRLQPGTGTNVDGPFRKHGQILGYRFANMRIGTFRTWCCPQRASHPLVRMSPLRGKRGKVSNATCEGSLAGWLAGIDCTYNWRPSLRCRPYRAATARRQDGLGMQRHTNQKRAGHNMCPPRALAHDPATLTRHPRASRAQVAQIQTLMLCNPAFGTGVQTILNS